MYDMASPAYDLVAVTPSDTVNVGPFRWLYVGVAGDVTLITRGGDTVLLKTVAAGVFHPVQGTRIKATGTAATSIVVGI